jgi:hypothetical protein
MFSRQRGCLPLLTFFGGFFLILYFSMAAIYGVTYTASTGHGVTFESLPRLMGALAAFGIFVVFGFGIIGTFPDVVATNDGIRYRYFGLFGGLILWKEIVGLTQLRFPKGCVAILIDREGYNRFVNPKGLFFLAAYGQIVKSLYPVLLLSGGLERREQLLDAIRQNSPRLSTMLSPKSN